MEIPEVVSSVAISRLRVTTELVPGLSVGATPPQFSGLSDGSVFVVVTLTTLLVFLYVVETSDGEHREIRRTLIAAIVPLSAVFAGIVLFSL